MPNPVHPLLANRFPRIELLNLLRSAQHWYRADTSSLSGANLATLPNRGLAGGSLTVSAGTLAAPTADANFGGAQSVTFAGTQELTSSLPPNAWQFLQDGSGCEICSVVYFSGTAINNSLWTTRNATTGATNFRSNDTNSHAYALSSGGTLNLLANTGAITTDASMLIADSFGASAVPQYVCWNGNVAVQAGSATTTGATPDHSWKLGGAASGTVRFRGGWAETLIFDFVLTPYERQLLREYVQNRYGIAAPVVPAEDRPVLKLNPFSWIRADYYSTASGKVSAFLDKVLPGHSMAQGTAANQVSNPASSANWKSQFTAVFGGNQRYISSLPKIAWKFLHDGSGFHVFGPFRWSAGSTWQYILCSAASGGADGYVLGVQTANVRAFMQVALNGGALYAPVSSNPQNTSFLAQSQYREGASPEMKLQVVANVTTMDSTSAPSSAAPEDTLTWGSATMVVGGNSQLTGELPEFLIFNRVLSTTEVDVVKKYYLSRYGLS